MGRKRDIVELCRRKNKRKQGRIDRNDKEEEEEQRNMEGDSCDE